MISEKLIDRPEYIKKLNQWKNQDDLVKIVTGVRRCGKSKLFVLFQKELLKHNDICQEQVISINLEDMLTTKKIGLEYNNKNLLVGYEKLLDYILKIIKTDKMNYVFIDEVQLLVNWQIVANALRLQDNVDLYLTGSNAYMFSGDLSNSFGGRFIEIKIQPFSFKEYYNSLPKSMQSKHLQEIYLKYITESSFPQTVKFNSDMDLINDYLLNTVYLNTIQKDIIKRYGVSNTNKLDTVVRYMFDNIGNETSLRNIERGLKNFGYSVSAPTIDVYLKGLLDSYLLYKCDKYDIKGKKILNTNSKYYVADIGLRKALLNNSDRDFGHILENVVYLELLRRGYNVNVGKCYNSEIDFIVTKNSITEYYQVALNILNDNTFDREISPLEKLKNNYPKFLLTTDIGSGEYNGIRRINVFDWLLAG
jgi:hypothetical protein